MSPSADDAITVTNLLARMDAAYTDFAAYVDGLSDEQLVARADAAGWSAKDHLIHLAVWARGIAAALDRKPRWEAMGVSRDDWRSMEATGSYDELNEAIRARHADRSPGDVRADLAAAHAALRDRVATLKDEDLMRPYSHYQSWATDRKEPIVGFIMGNSAGHYAEHRPWIEAIVA